MLLAQGLDVGRAPVQQDPGDPRARGIARDALQAVRDARVQQERRGPLGFGSARMYVVFVPPDGRVLPQIMDIDELPDLPDPELVGNLMAVLSSVLDAPHNVGTQLAVLYARPGRRGLSGADCAWASALVTAARRHGAPLWLVHVANDEELLVVPPDHVPDTA